MSYLTISATDIPASDRPTAAAGYTAVMTGLADQLAALEPSPWAAATDCAGWTVRDMAAHLLGAQEDLLSVRQTLRRRRLGHRRYQRLSLLDAANQQQIDNHAADSIDEVISSYRANTPKVAHRVRSFPTVLSGIPVDKSMAPGGLPLRLGYLFNTIYLRDAWMHGIDLFRATGVPRAVITAETLVVGQILSDVATVWADGPCVELELTGDVSGTWRLGPAKGPANRVAADGVDFCRSLSGRIPDTGVTLLAGDPEVVARLEALRVLF